MVARIPLCGADKVHAVGGCGEREPLGYVGEAPEKSSYIEITEVIEKMPYKVGLWNVLPLNKSAVLGPKENRSFILPYRIVGTPGELRDVLANTHVRISLKLRTSGQVWLVAFNMSNQPQVLTPGMRVAMYYQPGVMLRNLDGILVDLHQKPRCRQQYVALTTLTNSLLTVDQIEKEFPINFDMDRMGLTVSMHTLTVGEDTVCISTDTPFMSQGKTLPMSLVEEEQTEKEILQLQAKGVITELEVGYKGMFHQLLAFPKLNSEGVLTAMRLTLDCRALNALTRDWSSPLPSMRTLVSRIPRSWTYFSKIDIKDGFFNVGISDPLSRFFCFQFQNRRWRFNRLVQGWSPSPCIFHRMMATMMKGLPVIVYIDDILVGAETPALHNQALREVMRRLERYGLKVKKSKMEVGKLDIEFLGFWITQGSYSLRPLVNKLRQELPTVENYKQLQRGVGLLNCFRGFLPHQAEAMQPLYQALAQKKFLDYQQLNSHFQELVSKVICSSLRLASIKGIQHFQVFTDWSNSGGGYCCYGVTDQGQGELVWLGSRVNPPWLQKCSSYLGEQSTILWALKQLDPIIKGSRVDVYSDSLSAVQRLNRVDSWIQERDARVSRGYGWLLGNWSVGSQLQFFFTPGTSNLIADNLSRWMDHPKLPPKTSVPQLSPPASAAVDQAMQVSAHGNTPSAAEIEVLKRAHLGHWGLTSTLLLLRTWGVTIEKEKVQSFLASCPQCQRYRKLPKPTVLGSLPAANAIGERVSLDFLGPLPRGSGGERYILVIIDEVSRYVLGLPCKNASSIAAVAGLQFWIKKLGISPRSVFTDNARAFSCYRFSAWCVKRSISLQFIPPHSHKSAGLVERMNSTLLGRLRRMGSENGKDPQLCWVETLPKALEQIRLLSHQITGFSSNYLVWGVRSDGHKESLDILQQARAHAVKMYALQRDKANVRRKGVLPRIPVGSPVLLYDHDHDNNLGGKLRKRWIGPLILESYRSPHVAIVRSPETNWRFWRVTHIDFLVAYRAQGSV